MLTLLKFKLFVLLLGPLPMASRRGPNVYSVPGHGMVRTKGCTVTAERMYVVIEGGRRPWLHFLDADGEVEGSCEIDVRINVVPPPVRRQHPIPRAIATTDGSR